MLISIDWEIAPFYRRWQGFGLIKILWWLWPIRWYILEEDRNCTCHDYYWSFQSALKARDKKLELNTNTVETVARDIAMTVCKEETYEENVEFAKKYIEPMLLKLGSNHIKYKE